MKQVQIVLGIVLTLALCYGLILASGGFGAGDQNRTVRVEPVIAGGALAPQDIIANTTNATGNVTHVGPSSISGRAAMPHDAVPVGQTGGSSRSSGGNSGGGGSSGEVTATPTENVTPAKTDAPIVNVTANVTVTATSTPTSTTTPTPEPTLGEIDPTPTPTTEITTEEWTGTAGVTRTYYYIINHDTKTTSIIVESEFPDEIDDTMMYYELCDRVYHFSNVELRNIYLHFHNLGYGPNGEPNPGGPSIDSRFGYAEWLIRWEYPVAESAILIYSENSPIYVVSTINFVQNAFMRDSYTGEENYIQRNYYEKQEVMPGKQPGKPRYYDLPVSVPIRLYREGRPDNPYLPATPTPEPTIEPTLTQELTQTIEPTPEPTSEPTPTMAEETTSEPRWVGPTMTVAEMAGEPTPIEESTAEPAIEGLNLEETPALTPEAIPEPIEEQTPVGDENETG